MSQFLNLTLANTLVILLMAVLAYSRGMFFPSQMMKQVPVGLPLAANGSFWGNLILMPFVLFLSARYSNQWGNLLAPTLALSFIGSVAITKLVYQKGELVDALAGAGRPITPAGYTNILYSTLVFASIILFYLTSTPNKKDLLTMAGLLFVYVPVANHVPLYYIQRRYRFSWCTDILESEVAPWLIMIATLSALTIATGIKLL